MKKVLGVVMIVLALVLAIAPIFTDCESQGKMLTTADGRSVSMKCHWTGIAEVAAAIPLALAGIYRAARPAQGNHALRRPSSAWRRA